MKITVKRIAKKPTYTIGNLYINGTWFSNTIEDKDRGLYDWQTEEYIKSVKVKGQTAIPAGTYKVLISYSPKYKRMMPLINNVKGFSGIRIHSGNTANDTEGCLIVGLNKQVGKVLESRATYNKLYPILYDAWKRGESITITIE